MAFALESKAATLAEAEQWAAKTLLDTGRRVFRIVTTEPAKPTFQPVPCTAITTGFEFYAIFFFSAEAKNVKLVGVWEGGDIPRTDDGYTRANLWLNKRKSEIRPSPAKVETKTKVAASIEPPHHPPPPPMFDLAVDYEATLAATTKAVKRRARALIFADEELGRRGRVAGSTTVETEPLDRGFMELKAKEDVMDNQLSWQVAMHSRKRKEWERKETQLLAVRLFGCSEQQKLSLYMQLAARQSLTLVLVGNTGVERCQQESDGKRTKIEGKEEEDKWIASASTKQEQLFIEVLSKMPRCPSR